MSTFATNGYWAVLEINDISVGLIPIGVEPKPPRQFVIQAHVRLIRTTDNAIIFDKIVHDDMGATLKIKEWVDNDSISFRNELEFAINRLCETIICELFMQTKLPINIFKDNLLVEAHVFGVKIRSPPIKIIRNQYTVDSLQPTIEWDSINRDNVTYDLRIWRAIGNKIGPVVYHREKLASTRHVLETPLEPSTRYFFSVRAHFLENGMGRVTEWSRYTLVPTIEMKIMTLGVASLIQRQTIESFYVFNTPRESR